jgi:DNA-binding MarR family transcriptional regulator
MRYFGKRAAAVGGAIGGPSVSPSKSGKASPLTKSEYELMAEFRYTLRRFLRFSEEGVKRAGLTPKQYQALLAIKGFPGRERVTVGEFAERLQIRHNSAVGLADRLAAQGLLAREQADGDRRQVMLALTARGSALLERLAAMHRAELRRLGPELSAVLVRLSSNLE